MKGISGLDRLKIIGLCAALAFPGFWIYLIACALVFGLVLHIYDEQFANVVICYIPLFFSIILFWTAPRLKTNEDRGSALLAYCVPIWLVSIPISIYFIAIKDFGGLHGIMNEDFGFIPLLKSNVISFVFTAAFAIFAPIIKDARQASAEKAEQERLRAEAKWVREQEQQKKQEMDQLNRSISQLKEYELNILPFLNTLYNHLNNASKDTMGNCIDLVTRNEKPLLNLAAKLNQRAEMMKCINRVNIHSR